MQKSLRFLLVATTIILCYNFSAKAQPITINFDVIPPATELTQTRVNEILTLNQTAIGNAADGFIANIVGSVTIGNNAFRPNRTAPNLSLNDLLRDKLVRSKCSTSNINRN